MHHPFPHAPSNPSRRVAVIGSGISGLSAAWLMSMQADVTLYEADTRIGGHSNTAEVETDAGRIPVDTGFIVYNELNYPNLVAMFDHLGVGTMASDMSFAASLDQGGFEYSGAGLSGLVAQEAELVSPGLVGESPDRDAEGNDLGTVTKSVNYSVLYMKAVKALQEAMERIEQLEAEMAEVKAQLS